MKQHRQQIHLKFEEIVHVFVFLTLNVKLLHFREVIFLLGIEEAIGQPFYVHVWVCVLQIKESVLISSVIVKRHYFYLFIRSVHKLLPYFSFYWLLSQKHVINEILHLMTICFAY